MALLPISPHGDPLTISASLYTTYRQCPQRALAQIQGVYGPTSRASFRGGLAHKVFAKHLTEGEIPGDEFVQTCKRLAGEHLGEAMASLHMNMRDFEAIVSEIGDMYARFKRLPTKGLVEAEQPFDVDGGGGVTVKGRMDAVFEGDTGPRIIDWKTGLSLDMAEPQLDFYAMAWVMIHDELPGSIEASSLATGENVYRVPTEKTVDDTLRAVAEMVTSLRSALASGSELERSAGPYCTWCPLLDTCAEGAAAQAVLT